MCFRHFQDGAAGAGTNKSDLFGARCTGLCYWTWHNVGPFLCWLFVRQKKDVHWGPVSVCRATERQSPPHEKARASIWWQHQPRRALSSSHLCISCQSKGGKKKFLKVFLENGYKDAAGDCTIRGCIATTCTSQRPAPMPAVVFPAELHYADPTDAASSCAVCEECWHMISWLFVDSISSMMLKQSIIRVSYSFNPLQKKKGTRGVQRKRWHGVFHKSTIVFTARLDIRRVSAFGNSNI